MRSVPGTFRIETLGCKANLYDSQRLAEALQSLGFRPARRGEQPDVCLVNTCTVTAVADRKSRQRVARMARSFPVARLFVTGCYASLRPEELRRIGGVRAVFGRHEWDALLRAIHPAPPLQVIEAVRGDFGICSFAGRARAFMKIQEGCDAGCSYCILGQVRGRPRSRPLADVQAEARHLAEAGFAEIVLTGIHLGFYGRDLGDGTCLADAVRVTAQTPGVQRVRLSSLEANELDERLLEAMGHPAVCPHLHLPLQSGDAEVLRRMNRRYGPEGFLRAVELARSYLQKPAITTDVMVGFPGETDGQFENTLKLCRQAGFSRIHVFPFSPRPGTPAAAMDGRASVQEVRQRAKAVRELGRQLAEAWARNFVGGRERVLFERRLSQGRLWGYTDRYVPLSACGPPDLIGRTVEVLCLSASGQALHGSLA